MSLTRAEYVAAVKALDDSRPVTAAMNAGMFAPVNVSQVVDVVGKTVYALVTGAVADRLAAAAGVSPGQQHAELAGGRRVHDVGPAPGAQMYSEQ